MPSGRFHESSSGWEPLNWRAKALLLSCLVLAACAHGEGARSQAVAGEAGEQRAEGDAGAPVVLGSPEAKAKFEACYQASSSSRPGLSVHTDALIILRSDAVVFVDLELPEEPELASCLRRAITSCRSPVPGAAGRDTFGIGGLAIDLGPPSAAPRPRPTRQALEERRRKMMTEAIRSGVLSRDDPAAREFLEPKQPTWPTAEQQAQLQACHEAAARDRPGLVVHRAVTFLARGATVLLVDLRVPEAPELASCLKERILSWPSPFALLTGETVISSFFIDLGSAPDWPAPEGGLCEHLARRDALVAEAVQRGLIRENDPLIARMKEGRPTHDPSGRACTEAAPDAGA